MSYLHDAFHYIGQTYGYEWLSGGVVVITAIIVTYIVTRDISDPRYKR
jgi:hypothetical protein